MSLFGSISNFISSLAPNEANPVSHILGKVQQQQPTSSSSLSSSTSSSFLPSSLFLNKQQDSTIKTSVTWSHTSCDVRPISGNGLPTNRRRQILQTPTNAHETRKGDASGREDPTHPEEDSIPLGKIRQKSQPSDAPADQSEPGKFRSPHHVPRSPSSSTSSSSSPTSSSATSSRPQQPSVSPSSSSSSSPSSSSPIASGIQPARETNVISSSRELRQDDDAEEENLEKVSQPERLEKPAERVRNQNDDGRGKTETGEMKNRASHSETNLSSKFPPPPSSPPSPSSSSPHHSASLSSTSSARASTTGIDQPPIPRSASSSRRHVTSSSSSRDLRIQQQQPGSLGSSPCLADLLPDMSFLSEEERRHIEAVMMRATGLKAIDNRQQQQPHQQLQHQQVEEASEFLENIDDAWKKTDEIKSCATAAVPEDSWDSRRSVESEVNENCAPEGAEMDRSGERIDSTVERTRECIDEVSRAERKVDSDGIYRSRPGSVSEAEGDIGEGRRRSPDGSLESGFGKDKERGSEDDVTVETESEGPDTPDDDDDDDEDDDEEEEEGKNNDDDDDDVGGDGDESRETYELNECGFYSLHQPGIQEVHGPKASQGFVGNETTEETTEPLNRDDDDDDDDDHIQRRQHDDDIDDDQQHHHHHDLLPIDGADRPASIEEIADEEFHSDASENSTNLSATPGGSTRSHGRREHGKLSTEEEESTRTATTARTTTATASSSSSSSSSPPPTSSRQSWHPECCSCCGRYPTDDRGRFAGSFGASGRDRMVTCRSCRLKVCTDCLEGGASDGDETQRIYISPDPFKCMNKMADTISLRKRSKLHLEFVIVELKSCDNRRRKTGNWNVESGNWRVECGK